jgi:excisionase family DNA binding protein
MDNERLITINELAERLSLHPVTVRGLHRRKVIPSITIGHRTLRFEFAAVVEALRRAGDPAAQAQA